MSHFAKVENGIVTQVIVVEQDVLDSGAFGDPASWVQTSYNTHGGQHPEGRPLRKNYAGIGSIYDSTRDAFYAPQPYPSWVLEEETCIWVPPVPYPIDGVTSFTQTNFPSEGLKTYQWDESVVNWVDITSLCTDATTSADTVTVGTTLA